jgi:hypothetical protein
MPRPVDVPTPAIFRGRAADPEPRNVSVEPQPTSLAVRIRVSPPLPRLRAVSRRAGFILLLVLPYLRVIRPVPLLTLLLHVHYPQPSVTFPNVPVLHQLSRTQPTNSSMTPRSVPGNLVP